MHGLNLKFSFFFLLEEVLFQQGGYVDEVGCVFVDGLVGFMSVLGVFLVWVLLVMLGIFDNGCGACYSIVDG